MTDTATPTPTVATLPPAKVIKPAPPAIEDFAEWVAKFGVNDEVVPKTKKRSKKA